MWFWLTSAFISSLYWEKTFYSNGFHLPSLLISNSIQVSNLIHRESPKTLGRNGICLCLVNARDVSESRILGVNTTSLVDTAALRSADGPSASRLRKWHVWRTWSKTNDNIIWKHVENETCGQSSAVGEMEHYTTVYLSFGMFGTACWPLAVRKRN